MTWPWDILAPGTWLVFGIIGTPVYAAVLGWFLGKPRDTTTALLGLSVLIGLIFAMWIPMLILTLLIGVVFF